jgi:hypothetical protein
MLSHRSLNHWAGLSLILYGLVTAGSSIAFSDDRPGLFGTFWFRIPNITNFGIDLFVLVVGVSLSVIGFRVKQGRGNSARTGITVMGLMLFLCFLGIIVLIIGPIDYHSGTDGVGFYIKAGREMPPAERVWSIVQVGAFAAWSAANLFMLVVWRRRLKNANPD